MIGKVQIKFLMRKNRVPISPLLKSFWQIACWLEGEEFVIEYVGLMEDPEYVSKMEAKQKLAKELGISIIVIEPKDIVALENKLGCLEDKALW